MNEIIFEVEETEEDSSVSFGDSFAGPSAGIDPDREEVFLYLTTKREIKEFMLQVLTDLDQKVRDKENPGDATGHRSLLAFLEGVTLALTYVFARLFFRGDEPAPSIMGSIFGILLFGMGWMLFLKRARRFDSSDVQKVGLLTLAFPIVLRAMKFVLIVLAILGIVSFFMARL